MSDSIADDVAMLAGQAVRITTGTRLHFGLLRTAAPFGGVGVMIDHPQTEIVIRPAESFQCPQEVSDRVVGIAQRIGQATRRIAECEPHELPGCAVEVVKRADPHSGLGSGTQLAMAVAEGLAGFCRLLLSPEELACRIAGRGERSAVGVHGYFQGGLIYEDADDPGELNAVKQRVAIADPWCVALFRPSTPPAQVSGRLEQTHFRTLEKTTATKRQQLAAIINEQLMPAAANRDFVDFADAVQRYNHESGLLFQSVQGGPYNGSAVSELVQLLIECGAVGVGQSSWGPTVFAWFENTAAAAAFQNQLPASVKVLNIAKALNRPRQRRLEK